MLGGPLRSYVESVSLPCRDAPSVSDGMGRPEQGVTYKVTDSWLAYATPGRLLV